MVFAIIGKAITEDEAIDWVHMIIKRTGLYTAEYKQFKARDGVTPGQETNLPAFHTFWTEKIRLANLANPNIRTGAAQHGYGMNNLAKDVGEERETLPRG